MTKCPSCNEESFEVIGLVDGRLKLRCDYCLHDWFTKDGPELKHCESLICSSWVLEGICDACKEHDAVIA